MKQLTFVAYIIVFTVLYPSLIHSQGHCRGTLTEYVLNSNNIRASFYPKGNKFVHDGNAGFLVPYPSRGELSTIFASSPWIAGIDDAGNFKLAVETYPSSLKNDYSVGPLTSIGTINDSICGYFDRAWTVYYEDITAHMLDYYQDFKVDDTILSIFTWPGRGNKFFEQYYGFELPFDNAGLAPFRDANGNNIYDPVNGDYPVVRFASHGQEFIPDQILWMIFNDLDTNEVTGHRPLRLEIQLTAFAFHCRDNEILNNTIFNSYRFIYRGLSDIDSTFFGMWTDYDLGCYADDAIGSDSMRSTEFVYNADSVDGYMGQDCFSGTSTYGDQPPIQSMTYLNYPMHSFIRTPSETENPIEVYRQLNGEWPDGTPITPEGEGYNPGSSLSPTKFLFNGDPRDTADWTSINSLPGGTDQRTLSSVYLGRLDPGDIKEVSMAYMFHYDSTMGHLDQFTGMYRNIDSLLFFLHDLNSACTPFPICDDNDCVWPGDFDKNGIADHRDYLMWGAMNGLTGPERNGLISWRGHYGEDWSEDLAGINSKHGDADGNGEVDINDIDIHSQNYLLSNQNYVSEVLYPPGNEIVLTALPLDDQGRIRNFAVRANGTLNNILGLTFEVEFDTSLFRHLLVIKSWPEDSARLIFDEPIEPNSFLKYSAVQTNTTAISIESDYTFLRLPGSGFTVKSGLPIPDSTVIRLRNLKAIAPDGTDLILGSEPLVIYREGFTAITDPQEDHITIYPNPARDYLFVEVQYDVEGEIINLQGQVMEKVLVSNMQAIDVSRLNPGVYFLRLNSYPGVYKVIIY